MKLDLLRSSHISPLSYMTFTMSKSPKASPLQFYFVFLPCPCSTWPVMISLWTLIFNSHVLRISSFLLSSSKMLPIYSFHVWSIFLFLLSTFRLLILYILLTSMRCYFSNSFMHICLYPMLILPISTLFSFSHIIILSLYYIICPTLVLFAVSFSSYPKFNLSSIPSFLV